MERVDSEAELARALGAAIHRYRKAAGFSQTGLGELVGKTQTPISALESGKLKKPPPVREIQAFEMALGVPEGTLLRVAGRDPSGEGFEATVLERLDELGGRLDELTNAVRRLARGR